MQTQEGLRFAWRPRALGDGTTQDRAADAICRSGGDRVRLYKTDLGRAAPGL